jgi:sodium-dependent dicarboxylate transporter 2/3/5
MDWRTATRMPWEVLLLIGGGFCLASGIRESGLDAVLGSQVARLVDPSSPLWTAAGVAFLTNMLSEVTSNTAITNVLMPVLAAAGPELSIDPRLLMAPAAIAASASFLLPVGTPPNALAFGTRKVPIGTMARAGIVLNVLVALAIAVVFQYWVRGVWGIEVEAPAWAHP